MVLGLLPFGDSVYPGGQEVEVEATGVGALWDGAKLLGAFAEETGAEPLGTLAEETGALGAGAGEYPDGTGAEPDGTNDETVTTGVVRTVGALRVVLMV